tara:strand:+ start:21030 stop:21185 length:156 start_codon:yes stop_codon:yes gene_type:complete
VEEVINIQEPKKEANLRFFVWEYFAQASPVNNENSISFIYPDKNKSLVVLI